MDLFKYSNKNTKQKKIHYEVTPITADDNCVGKSCSICGMGILSNDTIVFCPCCSLPYHYECWEENGGCGSYGCKATPEVEKTQTLPEDSYVEGWTTQKKCPECGATIKSDALICKFCKSKFPTEKAMTRLQWQNRFYSGEELAKVRFIVIGQFVLSSIGYLCLITALINLASLYLSINTPYKFSRLTSELKLVVFSSLVVSLLWIFTIAFGIVMSNY